MSRSYPFSPSSNAWLPLDVSAETFKNVTTVARDKADGFSVFDSF